MQVAAGGAALAQLGLPELDAGQVEKVHALAHHQQVLLAGMVLAQRVQVLGDMGGGAEVDLALHAQQLQLRAFGQRAGRVVAHDEAAVGAAAVEAHRAHRRARGLVEIGHQRQPGADQDRDLQPQQQRGRQRGGGDRQVGAVQARQAAPARQVQQRPGHQHQQPGDRRQRNVRQQRRRHRHQQQQPQCRGHAGQRRARARLQIGHRAVQRAAAEIAGEEAAGQVRQALAEELAVGVDALARARRHRLGDRHRLAQRDDRQRQRLVHQLGQA